MMNHGISTWRVFFFFPLGIMISIRMGWSWSTKYRNREAPTDLNTFKTTNLVVGELGLDSEEKEWTFSEIGNPSKKPSLSNAKTSMWPGANGLRLKVSQPITRGIPCRAPGLRALVQVLRPQSCQFIIHELMEALSLSRKFSGRYHRPNSYRIYIYIYIHILDKCTCMCIYIYTCTCTYIYI